MKAGWCDNRKLNISACARSKSMRIGEAQNPGPDFRQSLEELPGLTDHTQRMEARLLNEFLQWAQGFLATTTPGTLFDVVPSFLGTALRCYGDIMFQNRGSLAKIRHLIVACQRWKPHCRPFMSGSWELVRRWEVARASQSQTSNSRGGSSWNVLSCVDAWLVRMGGSHASVFLWWRTCWRSSSM